MELSVFMVDEARARFHLNDFKSARDIAQHVRSAKPRWLTAQSTLIASLWNLGQYDDARGKPETFGFLGFTHFCTRSHKWGSFVIGRKTIRKRMRAKLKAIKMELRKRMHDPVAQTGAWVKQMLQGHLNHYAVSGNHPSKWWLKTLWRRSQKTKLSWERFIRLADRFFPPIKTLHPLPCHRFDAKTRGPVR